MSNSVAECAQEAYACALRSWASAGVPGNPAAWLTTAARRRAIDAIRRERALRSRLPLLIEPEEGEESPGEAAMREQDEDPAAGVPDERLRLIFTCCHPALAEAGELITGCLRAGAPGRYVLQAAIASLYADAPTYEETDWPQLVCLYDALALAGHRPVKCAIDTDRTCGSLRTPGCTQ